MGSIIDFKTHQELAIWNKFLNRIRELCFGFQLPVNPEFLNDLVLHYMLAVETNIKYKVEIAKRITHIETPEIARLIEILIKENERPSAKTENQEKDPKTKQAIN
jgi:hypothetical protein